MLIPLTEPTAPRYIYINPDNNQVHLLVPMVAGQEISTDNTCKSTASLDDFFKGAAVRELTAYQSALEFDLLLLDKSLLRTAKLQRRNQIKLYIKTINAMKENYLEAATALMQLPSNLYSIQLRPRAQDHQSHVVNPVFSVQRDNDPQGTPLSALYNAMYEAYEHASITCLAPQALLSNAVHAALPQHPIHFEDIQRALTQQCQCLFALSVDFTKALDGNAVSQTSIDNLMDFTPENPATTKEYIEALLGTCAPNLFRTMPTPPFYNVLDNPDKTEKLSILTQFFLAQANLYCTAHEISSSNFGILLDASPDLSSQLACEVTRSLEAGAPVEERLCAFLNEHRDDFGLARLLNQTDIDSINHKFTRTYATVTATDENLHMDDFMVLDTTTKAGTFVAHQGSICTDVTHLITPQLDSQYFRRVRADCAAEYVPIIPPNNKHVNACIDLDMQTLKSRIKDHTQFKKLPPEVQCECMKSPLFQVPIFLHHVAQGKQDEAQGVLKEAPEAQTLLTSPGTFSDYSGRTFYCTAYEYAYWAKDTHMCRMMEQHMDHATKAELLRRVNTIEEHGLQFQQNGTEYRTPYCDLTPLTMALNYYVQGHDQWMKTNNADKIKQAWLNVGLAQRDLPVHVINEYCRPDRPLQPTPLFKENTLPRVVAFLSYPEERAMELFPLAISDSSGLGVNFALLRAMRLETARGVNGYIKWGPQDYVMAGFDLAAVLLLDEVRTAERAQSREILKSVEPASSFGM
jgi:hypothetical protein